MTTLFDMKRFYRFLEEASGSELRRKRELLVWFLRDVRAPHVRRDALFLLRKIEEELLSRL